MHGFDSVELIEKSLMLADQSLGRLERSGEVVVEDVMCFHQPRVDVLDVGPIIKGSPLRRIPRMPEDQLAARQLGLAECARHARRAQRRGLEALMCS